MAANAPGPTGSLVLGSLPDLQKDILGTFLAGAREHGGVVRYRTGPYHFLLVADPEGVKRVLVDNHRNYRKSTAFEETRPLLGNGLVTAEGEDWKRQRKLLQPAFHHDRLATFARAIEAETDRMLDRWSPGSVVDASAELTRLTLAIVTRTLFSVDVTRAAAEIGEAITFANEHVSGRLMRLLKPPMRFPSPANVRFRRAVALLDRVVDDIVRERRALAPASRPDDLLSMMMAAVDEQGGGLSDGELRDEVMTLLLAGHETSANALAWTCWLLAVNGDEQARVRAEPERGERVLAEALRLYPPAWIVSRNANAEDEVLGYRVPKDSFVALSPFVTHRLAAHWTEPETFDPDRFLPSREIGRARFAYFPFGGGPRQCIGMGFAQMEMGIVLARIVARFTLAPAGPAPTAAPLLTLRPKPGVPLRLSRA